MRTLRWGMRLAVAVAALVPYLRLPSCPLYPDAERAVTQNPTVTAGSFHDVVTSDFWGKRRGDPGLTGSYRPVVSLTWWLQARASGTRPAPLHLFDMLVHATAAVLVLLLLESLLAPARFAFLGALLFAVHPALSEAVCSVVGRTDLLAGTSFLGAWLLHRRAGRHHRGWDLLALACLAVALLSKEYAVVFPFLLLLFDLLEPRSVPRRRALSFAAAGIALVGLDLALRAVVLGAVGGARMIVPVDTPLAAWPFHARLANAIALLLEAARLLVLPVRLDHAYGIGSLPVATGFGDPRCVASLAVFGVVTVLAARRWRQRADPLPLLALVLFAVPPLPALNTIGITVILFAERFLYVPAVGFALAVAWTLERTVRGARATRLASIGMLLVAALGAFLTARRVEDWRSNAALAAAAVRAHPQSAMALFELGMARAQQGNFEEAARLTRASLDVQDTRPAVWRGYALVLDRLGRAAEAVDAWSRALDGMPPGVPPNRAWIQSLRAADAVAARSEEAIAALRAEAAAHPQDARRRRNLGRVLLQAAAARRAEERLPEAAAYAAEALGAEDLDADELFRAGCVLAVAGDTAGAAQAIRRAHAADPGIVQRQRTAAENALQLGAAAEAIDVFAGLLAASPDDVALQRSFARARALAPRPAAAAPRAGGR